VENVVPTLIQEIGEGSRSIESKVEDLASIPDTRLSPDEVAEIAELGNNKGCMDLKGGNPGYSGEPLPDRWALNADLRETASRWGVNPEKDLACTHNHAA
jgi:hypothetical protein